MNKLADDMYTVLLSSQNLGQATIDYPDEINIGSNIEDPYGYLRVDVAYFSNEVQF